MKTVFKWIAYLFAGTLAAAIVLAGLALAYLETDRGRDWAIGLLLDQVAEETDLEVTAGTIEGRLLDRVVLRGIAMRTDGEPVVTVTRLAIDWRPRRLIGGTLAIDQLVLAEPVVLRPLPVSEAPPDEPLIALPAFQLPFGLAVEDIRIERLDLRRAVAGVPARFNLRGRVIATAALDRLDVALDLRRTDRVGDRAEIALRANPASGALQLSADIAEAPGGMIGRLIGAGDRGLALRLAGDGDLAGWQGRLDGQVGGQPLLDAELELAAGETLAVSLNGRARPRLIEPQLEPLGDWWRIDLGARVDRRDVVLEGLTLETRALTARAEGRFGRAGEDIDARIDAEIDDLAPLGRFSGTELAGAGNMRAEIAGPAVAPEIDVATEIDNPAFADISAERLSLSAHAGPAGDAPDSWTVTGDLRLDTVRRPRPEGVIDTVERFTASGRIDLEPPANIVRVRNLAIQADFLQIAGNLQYAYGDRPRLTGQLSLAGTPPPALTGGIALGATELDIGIDADPERLQGRLSATGRIDDVRTGTKVLDPLLAGGVDVAMDGEFSETRVGIDRLAVRGDQFTLTGRGALRPNADSEVRLRLDLPRLAVFSDAIEDDFGGSAVTNARLSGTPSSIAARITVDARSVRLGGTDFGAVAVQAESDDLLAEQLAATVNIESEGPVAPLTLSSRVEFDGGDLLRVADIDGRVAGVGLAGDLTVDLAQGLARGPFALRADDLAPAGRLIGEELSGRLRADGQLEPRAGKQALRVNASVESPSLGAGDTRIDAERLTFEGGTAALSGLTGIEGELRVIELREGDIRLEEIAARARQQDEETAFSLEARGRSGALPLLLDTDGAVVVAGPETRVTVARLSATYGQAEARLVRPTSVTLSNGRILLDTTALTVQGGQVTMAGEMANDRLSARLEADGLPASLLERTGAGPPMAGAFSADIRAEGPASDPGVTFRITAADIRPPGSPEDASGIEAVVDGDISGGRLRAEGEARGLGGGPFTASADFPFRWGGAASASAPVEGRAAGEIELGRLARLGLLRGHRAAGTMRADFTLGGVYGNPVLDGRATLSDGEFENIETGTLLRQLNLNLIAQRNVLTVQGNATDGGGGRMSADGRIDLDASRAFPFEAEIRTDNATLLRRDEIEATLTSDLATAGDFDRGITITGTMTVNRAEISIPERLPVQVVFLEVEEVHTPPHLIRPQREEEERAPPLPVRLDVTVDVPRRTFLRGRGIDTEWEGRLQITGALPDPQVTGTLSTVRGSVDLLGKRFEVERGEVRFDRDDFADPSLSIRATGQRGDLTAIILIDGSAQDPRLTLSAEPERPPEEVLSHVLFGEDVSQLSATQAAQLAAAVAQLLGPEGGTDIITRIRRTLGLDVLEFTEGEGTTPGVRAGRYIGERTLLRVEQGAETGSSRVGVEVEVLDNLVIESEVGAQGDTRAGAQYRLDY